MSKEESRCRSASALEPAFEKENSVGRGTVNCGILAARAAAAVEGTVLEMCRAICSDKRLNSLTLGSLENVSTEVFETTCPFERTLFITAVGRWTDSFLLTL